MLAGDQVLGENLGAVRCGAETFHRSVFCRTGTEHALLEDEFVQSNVLGRRLGLLLCAVNMAEREKKQRNTLNRIDNLIKEEIAGEETGKINPGKQKLFNTGQFEMYPPKEPAERPAPERPQSSASVRNAVVGDAPPQAGARQWLFWIVFFLLAAVAGAAAYVYLIGH
ncbi:MAG: hypothetical protein KC609_05265 [Myxococcales bacterium]|nr:hypothetical protein [Myxococcales bacterium]